MKLSLLTRSLPHATVPIPKGNNDVPHTPRARKLTEQHADELRSCGESGEHRSTGPSRRGRWVRTTRATPGPACGERVAQRISRVRPTINYILHGGQKRLSALWPGTARADTRPIQGKADPRSRTALWRTDSVAPAYEVMPAARAVRQTSGPLNTQFPPQRRITT